MNEGAITTLLSLLAASRADVERRHRGLSGRQAVRATVAPRRLGPRRAGGRARGEVPLLCSLLAEEGGDPVTVDDPSLRSPYEG